MEPRVVVVTRPSTLQGVRQTYGSMAQASFRSNAAIASTATRARSKGGEAAVAEYAGSVSTAGSINYLNAGSDIIGALKSSEQHIDMLRQQVLGAVPRTWRTATVPRPFLDRFVFEPNDIIAVVGPDGLVANVAKYLRDHQPVIGFHVDPSQPGVLAHCQVHNASALFAQVVEDRSIATIRTMVQVELDSGQTLRALNELYLGHRSHQSSRYELAYGNRSERQSSSGVIVSTGTGATGWCSSILLQCGHPPEMAPAPDMDDLLFLVREAWPSPSTGTELTMGRVGAMAGVHLTITSEMDEGGVIFGDGIEGDFVEFGFGTIAEIAPAPEGLALV